jgi:hypothetical protein
LTASALRRALFFVRNNHGHALHEPPMEECLITRPQVDFGYRKIRLVQKGGEWREIEEAPLDYPRIHKRRLATCLHHSRLTSCEFNVLR